VDHITIPGTGLNVSRIGLGTWAIGGWMWGGTEERQSIETIHAALGKGVNLIDTAPVYGFGTSEEIVGKAVEEYGQRDGIVLSTKAGLDWTEEHAVYRNGSRNRIMAEFESSLKRLRTDRIEIYFVHWPDCARPIAETAGAVRELYEQGAVKAVGVSNFTQDQMETFRKECPLHLAQPAYNIFERAIDSDIKPWCERNNVVLMSYGALCRGLLSGRMSQDRVFGGDDLRKVDPKFQEPRFSQYLEAVRKLNRLAQDRFSKSLIAFSVRWVFEKGVPLALWGGRSPAQMEPIDEILGWSMDSATLSAVDSIVAQTVLDPVGPEFMAPPTGMGTKVVRKSS
jgi:aryl-alcohol dehydrogenase-like predicted oxidoreductase